MHRTKIEWTDYTWNPITGCLNNCFYCYGRKMYKRFKKSFKPQIHYDRLSRYGKTPLDIHKPVKIFTCSVSDLFAPWVPEIWRLEVFNVIGCCLEAGYKHIFQILTKFPELIKKDMPENVWLGVTITNKPHWRKLYYLTRIETRVRFVSFEPLLEDLGLIDLAGINWVIIGAVTGPESKKHQPKREWVQNIIRQAKQRKIPAFLKNNLIPIMGKSMVKRNQHFPKQGKQLC